MKAIELEAAGRLSSKDNDPAALLRFCLVHEGVQFVEVFGVHVFGTLWQAQVKREPLFVFVLVHFGFKVIQAAYFDAVLSRRIHFFELADLVKKIWLFGQAKVFFSVVDFHDLVTLPNFFQVPLLRAVVQNRKLHDFANFGPARK